jgi:glycosidase
MAFDTPPEHRSLVIYEVYVRSHGPTGTFAEVEADLERIQSMGVDVVWLMPIHPIGKVKRKGSLGSPYSIVDYRGVNPEYGTKEDFARLVGKAHDLGLKVMIDVVYNHTAHDSVLVSEHPEFFHKDAEGKPVTTVPEWSDVIDLKHPHPALSDYLIETLRDWVLLGVDGFRCDVASLVPVQFWQRARVEVAQVKPGVIWLAETVHAGFVGFRRSTGLSGYSDSEVYLAFDLAYDYDIWPIWQAAVTGKAPVGRYLEMLRFQECIYPENYVKMRCVENHDNLRIQGLVPELDRALAWTAFQAFNKGAFLIYAGQESAAAHTPSLFEREPVEWGDYPLQTFLTRLAAIKKNPALTYGRFVLAAAEPAIQAAWIHPEGNLFGVFNVSGEQGTIPVPLPDGRYADILNDGLLQVKDGKLALPASAAILLFQEAVLLKPLHCDLLDFGME